MARRYYSSRKSAGKLTVEELYSKLQNLYLLYLDKDFFKEKSSIDRNGIPKEIMYKAAIALKFQPFPITEWDQEYITEDNIFDVLEFLFDHVSKPQGWVEFIEDGYKYSDYEKYDEALGKEEFRSTANIFLVDYKSGFELTKEGMVLALGTDGLQYILDADIVAYDEKNVDSKVRNAIEKWRNRRLSISEKKEAIRELADVFEWLKKTKGLSKVLNNKDESALFEIANNFSIRHHDPKQKTNYDNSIWYSWIFHFYLATYHAVVRLLLKKEKN